MLPEIVEPDFVIELDTITPRYAGMLFGGPELFPGFVVHAPPWAGGFVLVESTKPLKLAVAVLVQSSSSGPSVPELALWVWCSGGLLFQPCPVSYSGPKGRPI
jgi:hypothetical protein